MELKMENRLCLNKKKEYNLPDGTEIFSYNRSRDKDKVKAIGLRLSSVGASSGKLLKDNEVKCGEIIIKTNNYKIIDFIKSFDFTTIININSVNQKKQLDSWKVREVVSNYYYGE